MNCEYPVVLFRMTKYKNDVCLVETMNHVNCQQIELSTCSEYENG